MYGGWAGNAFTTLTGGISEKMKTFGGGGPSQGGAQGDGAAREREMKTFSTDGDEPVVSSDQLYRRLHNALASGYVMYFRFCG